MTVTVNTLPDTPSAGNINVMYDGSPHAGTASVPTGFTVAWYTAATGGRVTVLLQEPMPESTQHGQNQLMILQDALVQQEHR